MRVLFFIEPAVFRGDPFALAPHVQGWALPMLQRHDASGFQWALASSAALCALARRHQPELDCFAIPSWRILSSCGYRRDVYTIALFHPTAAQQGMAGEGPLAPLAAELQAINRAFEPDAVIATGENRLLPLAFPQARCLWMEQAPFPRQKRRDRLYFDPCGHQLGSVLEQAGERILGWEMSSAHLAQVEALWRVMQAPSIEKRPQAAAVQRAIRDCTNGRRVALLVLQPPDWPSWEGCLDAALAPEAVLAQWAAALPPGWVGIPLHHPDARMPASLEASLAAAFPQLALLPPELNANVAEWALPVADAMVCVSSSMAGQALITGKHVVVMGRTPLRALAPNSLEALSDSGPTLSRQQRASLLAFLSHRYTLTLAEIGDPHGPFLEHLRNLVTSADPVDWLLDLSGWSPERLARLL